MAQVYQPIQSRQHPLVKQYHKLCCYKKYRDQTGYFAIESRKLVYDAFAANISIEKVFITEQCLQKHGATLQKLFDRVASVRLISAEVEQKMTMTKNAGGLFAICKKLDKYALSDKIVTNGKYVYLCAMQDTGNVGTIIRTAEALGLDGVIISDDTSDIYSLKVIRASMGAVFRIQIIHADSPVTDILRCNQRFVTYAAVLDSDATDVLDVSFAQNSILVIGNEGSGLPQAVAEACTSKLAIRMNGQADSLNAGIAAGILMWEQGKRSGRMQLNHP